MDIHIIENNKDSYMDLLLLADPQEDMIYKYLNRGTLFALYDEGLKTLSVVTEEGPDTCEIKNIATYEAFQNKGYGRKMLEYIFHYYKNKYDTILVGTGDTPKTLNFYKSCGFRQSHISVNFFLNNYSEPILEDGKQLIHMIYLKKQLK